MALLPDIDPSADWRTVGSTVPNPAPGQADEVSVARSLMRDVLEVGLIVAAWFGYEAWAVGAGSPLLLWMSVPLAAVAAFFGVLKIHEWGHFTGARAFGGHAPITRQFGRLLLFQFNMVENTRLQFLMMSVLAQVFGFAAVTAVFLLAPGSTPGAMALKSIALGAFLIGLSTDTPVIWRSLKGLDNAEAWRPHFENLSRNRLRAYLLGAGAALGYPALALSLG